MGKKSRSAGVVAPATPAPTTTATTAAATPVGPAPTPPATWGRLKRSFIVMLLIAGFAMTDLLTLKEGVTVIAPDHKPLLALVTLFGWLVWRRWTRSEKQGLHPFVRTVGFAVILAGCLAALPFNATVSMLEVPLLTEDQCRLLAEAAAETISVPGFVPSFSLFDPSTEVPVQDLPVEVSAMVSEAIRKQLLPFVSLEYGSQGEVSLDERLLYVEHYSAHHEPAPPAHVRQGQLALRVELTPPESKYVGGGGVFLDSVGKTITPGMGSGLVLPAKIRHGSSQPGSTPRSVLVGSLAVRGRDPMQRFVGMWRLWGLFSRSVRYIADRRLASSGVDTLPVPDPDPEEAALVGEGGLGSGGGGDKLEF